MKTSAILEDIFDILPAPAFQKQNIAVREFHSSKVEAMDQEAQKYDLSYFARRTLTGPPKEPFFGKFMVAGHHLAWAKAVRDENRTSWLAPRYSGKTHFWTLALPLWRAIHHHGLNNQFMIISKTQPQVISILEHIKKEILRNPKLRYLYSPRLTWSKLEIELTNGYVIRGRGFGSSVRGAHPDHLVCDDVLHDRTAYNASYRDYEIQYFQESLEPTVHSQYGSIHLIGTPQHTEDLMHFFRKHKSWMWRKYQSINKDPVTGEDFALWPELWPLSELYKKRDNAHNTLTFSKEYQCEPITDLASMFPSELFTKNYNPNVRFGMKEDFDPLDLTFYFGVDFAISASTGADYFVIMIVGVDKAGNRWICDYIAKKGVGFQDQKSLIISQYYKWRPERICVETVAAQQILGDELQTAGLPILKHNTSKNSKLSLAAGIPGIRNQLEKCRYNIPIGGNREPITRLENELKGFVMEDGKIESTATHDDAAMGLYLAEQCIWESDRYNFTFGLETPNNNPLLKAHKEHVGSKAPVRKPANLLKLAGIR